MYSVIVLSCGKIHGQSITCFTETKNSNGEIIQKGVFDTINNFWNVYHFYELNGDTTEIKRYMPDGLHYTDTTFGFHSNGKLAYYRIFHNDYLHGNFEVFDTTGKTTFKGQYCYSIRTGTWEEYDKKGKVTAFTKYQYEMSDSVLLKEISDDYIAHSDNIVIDDLNFYYDAEMFFVYRIQLSSLAFIKKRRIKKENSRTKELYNDGL